MKELRGKVAVVTGAGSGIGRAMAERFAREGMKVVLADVEDKSLAAVQKEIGANAIAVRTDVTKADQVEALRAKAIEAFGAVHVLCNNAGVALGGPAWDRSIADWEWILGVNLWGVIHGIRTFVPAMIAQGEGHVVNTASIAGMLSIAAFGPYCVTKHAVVTLSECLHHDLTTFAGGKVKVSVLCPGFVQTRIHESDRNRPEALREKTAAAPSPIEAGMAQMMAAAIAGGIAPTEVADHVLRAIVDERFYIFTHPKLKGAVKKRMDEILEERTPTFDPTLV
jgi:NADP-dependent 3-hydroxy acid dehydrogenase YdfG